MKKVISLLIIVWLCVMLGLILLNHFTANNSIDSPDISLLSTLYIRKGMSLDRVTFLLGGHGESIGSGTIIQRYSTYAGSIVTISYNIDTDGIFRVSQIRAEEVDRSIIFLGIMLAVAVLEFLIYRRIPKKTQTV